jgi:photosystem II stability/assembly factor-like uncharacterized protein
MSRPRLVAAALAISLAIPLALPRDDAPAPPAPADPGTRVPEDFRPARPAIKQPNEHFHAQRAFPFPDIPAGAHAAALAEARAMPVYDPVLGGPAAPGGPAARAVAWSEAGPFNVGGRITAIAVDPDDPQRVFIGAADGGVLRSVDGGDSWTPLLDEFGGLSVGDLAHHPTTGGELLCGTGEANASGDSYDGIGLLRTTDGGDTWSVIGLEETQRIARIAYDRTDADRVFVAASGGLYTKGPHRGVYRSTDGGATWSNRLFLSDSTSAIDVVVDPTNGDRVYAAMWDRLRGPGQRTVAGPNSGIWRSTDGGDTWSEMTNGVPTGTDVARIGLAVASSAPTILYASYSTYSTSSGTTLSGVYRSTNFGTSWTPTAGSGLGNPYSSFGWYFGRIEVDPTDPNEVWVLGVDLVRSTTAGSTWSTVTGSQHVDMHALWTDPQAPNLLFSGNDGGFFVSSNNGSTWAKKLDLPITQFYAITVDPQLPHRIYGGTQDNSTPRTLTGAPDDWDVIAFGDGFTVIVDPLDSNVIYAEYQYGGLLKSTDLGSSWDWADNGVSSSDRINWHMPYVMDPNDHLDLYLGTHRVYRTTNGAASWTPVSPDLTDGPGSGNLTFGTLTSVAVSGLDASVIWAGSDDGNVHVTTNGGTSWNEVDAALPVRYVTRVVADPFDTATGYVTLSGYALDEFLPHVFRTDDHGATWTDLSGNLPAAPVNDLVVDPESASRFYVATDVGVYVTNDLGASWAKLGSGLPLAVVVDLELHAATRTLVAGTHGRSSFTLDLAAAVDAPEVAATTASGLRLAAPWPNPSTASTTFEFTLPAAGPVRLAIFDVTGRRVRTLRDGPAPAGPSRVAWDGRDEAGRAVAAGVYFARLEAAGETRTVKLSRSR